MQSLYFLFRDQGEVELLGNRNTFQFVWSAGNTVFSARQRMECELAHAHQINWYWSYIIHLFRPRWSLPIKRWVQTMKCCKMWALMEAWTFSQRCICHYDRVKAGGSLLSLPVSLVVYWKFNLLFTQTDLSVFSVHQPRKNSTSDPGSQMAYSVSVPLTMSEGEKKTKRTVPVRWWSCSRWWWRRHRPQSQKGPPGCPKALPGLCWQTPGLVDPLLPSTDCT